MNYPILFLINLLRDNIKLNDKIVPLISRSYPEERMPCITFDNSGGSVTLDKFLVHNDTEQIVENIETTIKVHIWCVSEEDRNSILSQIRLRDSMCFADHYEYCTNYQKNGICKTNEKECLARTKEHNRSVKNKCPDPINLKYENSFVRFHIDKMNYNMNASYDIDDLTTKQRTIHSILPVDFVYQNIYDLGGKEIKKVTLKL